MNKKTSLMPFDDASELDVANMVEFGTNEELAQLFADQKDKGKDLVNYNHDDTDFISMAGEDVHFAGFYLGLTIRSKKDGSDMTLVNFFDPETEKRFQVYGAFNLLKFLTENNFPVGHYLAVRKAGTQSIGSEKSMSLFDFSCSPESIKLGRLRRLELKKADEQEVLEKLPF